MPMYDFECQACQHRWEQMAKSGEVPPCPECGAADVEKILSFGTYKAATPASGSMEAKVVKKIDGSYKKVTGTTTMKLPAKDK